LPLSL